MGLTGGKGGGKNALAAKPNLLNALQVQTSSYGQVIPILYGQNRIAGRLLWSGDFQSIAHTSTQKVGGKGLGSSGGNTSTTSYTYQTAVAIALCMGPIQNLGSVWDTKGQLTLLSTSVQYTVPSGGGSFTPTPPVGGVWHSGRGVGRLDSYSLNPNDYGSDGTIALRGTQNMPMVLVGSSPGAGQYTLNPSTGQHTFSAADAGKVMTLTYAYSVPTSNSTTGAPATVFNLTVFLGQRPQTPWSYLTSSHPGQDLGYNGIAYIASSAMDLGNSGALPNLSYEVLGLLPFGAGITDAEPSAIIQDLVSNPFYGLNGVIPFDTAATIPQYQAYCVANGIFLSPVYDSQQTAAQCIQDILDITNAEAVWSEGVLKIRSYGDTTAVGNGATFSPTTTPIYDIDSGSYLDAVTIKRPSVADVMNDVSVEFVDRSNSYNVAVAEDKDEAQIAIYGLRKAQPKTSHSITSSSVAAFVANLLRKRQVEIRNTYTVKVGWQYALLEPMDLVTLTIPELGYTKKPVRILSIREDSTGQLQMECEDFPWGTATPTLYAQQAPTRFAPQTNADPGNVNAPIVFEAPVNLSKSGQHEVWMAVSGSSPNWGGCSVWLSQDNSEYHQIGRILSPARMGVCGGAGTFGVTGDPYTGGVGQTWDLTESHGVLTAGTQQDADSYRTLVYFDGEFMSYANLTLVSANVYNPAGYIRRGLFGSTVTTHNLGSPVARLDDAIFTYVYDPAFLGKTIYLKFTSFNSNGLVEQSIANATAYQFVVTGKFCQMETVSKNLIANPGFDSNQVKTPMNTDIFTYLGRITDNWVVSGPGFGSNSTGFAPFVTVGGHSNTSGIMLINRLYALPSFQMPNNFFAACSCFSDPVPITPGESYAFGGWVWLNPEGYGFPTSGWGMRGEINLVMYDAAGVALGPLATGVTPGVFMRLVTETNPQAWQYLSNYATIPLTTTGGVNWAYASGVPAYVRLQCSFWIYNQSGSTQTITNQMISCFYDDVFLFPQWAPTGDEIAKLGSMSITYSGGLTYTSNTNSITWSWNINANRTDRAMSINNYNSSQAVTGLATGTSYNFYPFIDEVNQVVSMVATQGIGSPSWAHNGTSLAWTQEQARGDHWPLSSGPVAGATTTSGSGGGGSGGGIGGSCLRHDVLVEEKTKGVIAVRDLALGDLLRCPQDPDTPQGWVEVIDLCKEFVGTEWVHTFFNCEDWLATTPGHPFTLSHDGAMKRAAQLCLEDAIPCLTGVTFPVSHETAKYPARKVRVSVRSRRHVFYAGMKTPCILQHNYEPNS
jgi:hypothetical protein